MDGRCSSSDPVKTSTRNDNVIWLISYLPDILKEPAFSIASSVIYMTLTYISHMACISRFKSFTKNTTLFKPCFAPNSISTSPESKSTLKYQTYQYQILVHNYNTFILMNNYGILSQPLTVPMSKGLPVSQPLLPWYELPYEERINILVSM